MAGRSERRHRYAKGIYTFEESVALIKSLTTMECKVAHEIRYVAVRLYKASKAIDKQSSKVVSEGPDDIKFFIQRSDKIFKKPYHISTTDLAEIEDLYYATCAKVKALLKIVTIYIDEGFRAPDFEYFSYDSPGLRHLAPVELWQFRTMLEIHEIALYSERITEPLNAAVLRKNWCLLNRDGTTPDPLPCGPKHHEVVRYGQFVNGFERSPQVQGLQDLRNKPCGLVFAELTEKYNPIARKERTARIENEQRRALLGARAHKIETIGDSPTPKLDLANGERVDACDSSKYRNKPGQLGEKHPFGANNNPMAQLMLAGLAIPNTTMFSQALDTVETQPSLLDKMRLEEHDKFGDLSKLCRVSTSAYTPKRQHKAGSRDHLTTSTSGSGPFCYLQSAIPAGVHTSKFARCSGDDRVQRPFFGGRYCSTLPGSASAFVPVDDETTTGEDEKSKVVKPQLGSVSRGILLDAKGYERRLYTGKQDTKEVKDGRKRASSEVSFGSFKRVARSGS